MLEDVLIYRLKCSCSKHEGKTVYVGSTKRGLTRRLKQHFCWANNNIGSARLHRHMRKVGTDEFTIRLVAELKQVTPEKRLRKEDKFILKYGTINLLNTKWNHLTPEQAAYNKKIADREYDRTKRDKQRSQAMAKARIEANPNRYKCEHCEYAHYYKCRLNEHISRAHKIV